MKTRVFAAGILLLASMAGCASSQQQNVDNEGIYRAPASIYSVMDSTSLVYTDVAAGSPLSDNPWRWMGFVLHPVGQVLDYGINRPIYSLTSHMPYLFGYTSEDAMLDSQRR
ncbi:MAG TPA: hypothetical protein VKP13_10430 [Nitrospira sp.]|nr:hypothetical protein [Nitrospira sp.]